MNTENPTGGKIRVTRERSRIAYNMNRTGWGAIIMTVVVLFLPEHRGMWYVFALIAVAAFLLGAWAAAVKKKKVTRVDDRGNVVKKQM